MFATFDWPGFIPVVCPVNTFILSLSSFVARFLFVLLSKVFTLFVRFTTFVFVLFIDWFNVVASAFTKS